MFGKRKILIYSSKDQADWEKAQGLLREAGIECRAWAAEESPAGGCGGKADPRTFLNGKKSVPKTVYKIEVAAADEPGAKKALDGKVRPVLSYGYTI